MTLTPTDYFYAAIKDSPTSPKRLDKGKIRMKIRTYSPETQQMLFRMCMESKDFYQRFIKLTSL